MKEINIIARIFIQQPADKRASDECINYTIE